MFVVALFFSVGHVVLYTVLKVFSSQGPGQNPGQKSGQKSGLFIWPFRGLQRLEKVLTWPNQEIQCQELGPPNLPVQPVHAASFSSSPPPLRKKRSCTQAVLVDLGGQAPDTEFRDLAIEILTTYFFQKSV